MEPTAQGEKGRVGRYHLVDRLAVGGMAEVYLACERGALALDRLIVIKKMLPHLAEDNQFVSMFMQEARIVARIQHPNVVEIYELGEAGGYPYIAMEYVEGSTLKDLDRAARFSDTQIPMGVVIDLMCQASAGAHAAHELSNTAGECYGLVHRDISPHNLMVDAYGHVKLLDFGIAKASHGMDFTRTGMLKGKISYMSPEQCRQEPLDRRSDVFALGIVTWQLLGGEKPFGGRSELATMQNIVTGAMGDLRTLRPEVPEGVVQVIERALCIEAIGRYDTADAFRRELSAACRESGVLIDRDVTASIVAGLLGEAHAQRRANVDAAMDRTLLSLSAINLLDPATTEDVQPEHLELLDELTKETLAPSRRLATVGLVGLGIAGLTGIGWLITRPAPPPALVGEVIVVSIAPTLEPAVLMADHEPIRQYLERATLRPVEFRISTAYKEAAMEVATGAMPFAFLPHNTVNWAYSKNADITPMAVKVVDGSATTDGYMVVPRSVTAATPVELRGTTICYSDELSNTGYRLPRKFLTELGLEPQTDFVTHISGNHDQVLRDLVNGVCKIGGTFSGNYNTADQRGIPTAQLRIMAITGSTPHDAFVAGPSASSADTLALRDALLAFDPQTHVGTDRVGESERITGFTVPTAEYGRD